MEIVLTSTEIRTNVMRFAKRIDQIFPKGTPLVLLGVLDGGLYLLHDLSKALFNYYDRRGVEIHTTCIKSYKGVERGEIQWIKKPICNVIDKNVVIIDDINDSGVTLDRVENYIKEGLPKKVITCVMLERESSAYHATLSGKTVQDGWFFGYGMDNNGIDRNNPNIYKK